MIERLDQPRVCTAYVRIVRTEYVEYKKINEVKEGKKRKEENKMIQI